MTLRLPIPARRFWAAFVSALLVATGLFVVAAAPARAATRAFTPVYTTNTTGDVMIRGNSLETCPVGSLSAGSTTLTCANVQNGTSNGVNNNFKMGYVDTDSDSNTFDSSDATVTIPAGATVLYAGLSWSATSGAGSLAGYSALTGVAAPNAAIRNQVKFKVPGGTSYTAVTSAAAVDTTGSGYQGFKDVTAAVGAAGSGVYTVADVQAGTGGNDYAGWALAVAYRDPTQPTRNLVIYNGFTNVANGASTTIPISGFTTPLTGPVVTRMGAVVYEGDRGNIGDTMTLGVNAIANGLNPVTDVENSSISDLGVAITNRTPAYNNSLSIDIDRFDATGFLTNGQTSTTINLKTVGDGYYPALVSLATNLYSPSLQATKTVKDVTSGITSTVKAGDELAYAMAITNVGGDGSTASILTDTVPTGTTYLPGSLVIGGTPVTDASGDDAGDVTGSAVTARLGTGATPTAGGALVSGASTTVAFHVTVNAGVANGTVIANAAALGYTSATTGKTFIGASNTVSSTVSVINVNPVLAFAAPPSAEVSAAYTNTLTASGGTGPYAWAVTAGALPTGLVLGPTTGVVSGTPTATGIYTFTVSATDANAQVATQTASIYVAPQPVLAYPGTLQNADTGNAYSYPLGVNPGTGPYAWSVSLGTLPAGLTLDAATGVVSGTPTAAGARTFTVRVVDTFGASATEVTTLTVLAGPTLSNGAAPTGEISTPYSYDLNVTAGTSPFIWTTTGTLPAGITIDAASGLLSGTPTAAGTSNFTVTVTDVNGATASQAMTITIVAAPTLTGTLGSGEVTAPYSSGFTVSDGLGPYAWVVTSGPLPAGLSINATTGLITGTPSAAGSYPVTIQVTDASSLAATRTQTITVSAGPAVAFTPPNGEVGVSYTAQPTASGGTGPYTWAVSVGPLPTGLSINATTGAITGTPSAAGTASVTVQATDAKGGTATQAGSIAIVAAPTLTGTLATAEASAPYSSGFTVNDGTGPFVWSLSAGPLPVGLTLNTSTGLITGRPSDTGSSPITVQVTDANNRTATRSATITVTTGPVVAFTPPNGEVGVAYNAQPTASNGTGPYSWAVSVGTLPAGLTIDTGTGVITGTPSTAGNTGITVRATDANGGVATQAATITIAAAVSLTFAAPPAAELSATYSDQLTKSGGVGPFTWTVSVGSLPAGVTLASDTGLLSGTPTALGTFNFTVRIVDGNGQADTRTATLIVDKTTSTVSVSAPTSARFANTITITATVAPSSAGGTVTFTDVATTGPQAGNPVTLGTGTVSGGAASLTGTLPAFGVNTVKATYGGDTTHAAATSTTTAVEVSAYAGEVIVTEFRTSGPGGAADNYVELLNTGPTVPLAGFKVSADSGTVTTLPANAGLLGTGRSYLVTGAGFTLAATATSDYGVATVGTGGTKVTAPDTASTRTDAVGPATGFHTGTGLPAITGDPDSNWAWVRTELAGAAVDSRNNAADFQLVSTDFAPVGGVQPTLGSASPTGTADPYQHNATLKSTLLDTGKGAAIAPNRVVVTGSPGRLVIRRTITNTTGQTITAAKVRTSALSEQFGAPQPGVASQPARVAQLRAIAPTGSTEQVTVTGGATVTVQDLSPDAPSAGLGGGLNSTFTVPLPGGGLAPGATIDVAFTFAVVTHGTFWFGYDVDATTTATAPGARHANRAAARSAGRTDAGRSTTRHTAATVSGYLR